MTKASTPLSGSDGGHHWERYHRSYVYGLFWMGKLVYIGISKDPEKRATAHHRSDKQFDEMRVITSGCVREEMLLQERALIRKHRPRYNKEVL